LRIIFFGREEEKGDGVRSGGGGGRTANEVVVVRAQELITGFVWRGAFGWVNHRRRKTRQQQQQLFIDVSGCTRGGWCRWKVCGGVWVAVGDSIGIGGARQHRRSQTASHGISGRHRQRCTRLTVAGWSLEGRSDCRHLASGTANTRRRRATPRRDQPKGRMCRRQQAARRLAKGT
jgi:hypothetical protein